MIDHTGIGIADLERSAQFYDAVLGALGMKRVAEIEETDGNLAAALALYREALAVAEAVEGKADNAWRDELREAVERVRAELDRDLEAPPDDE